MFSLVRKLALVVPIAVIVAFGFRPTPILGVDGKSLAASTGVPVGEVGFEPCAEEGKAWTCTLKGEDSRPVAYTLDVDWAGCWTATVRGSGSDDDALEGCVTITDHVEAID